MDSQEQTGTFSEKIMRYKTPPSRSEQTNGIRLRLDGDNPSDLINKIETSFCFVEKELTRINRSLKRIKMSLLVTLDKGGQYGSEKK